MRVLVVDDHDVVRRGVVSLLENRPDCTVCGEARDGQDAMEKARELKPDIVVMDVSMPMVNGLDATRAIRGVLPSCEVLVLSQHDSPEMARQAFKAGARGYVIKSSLAQNLMTALDKVSRHESFFDPAISEIARPLDVQEILQRSAALEQALRESEQVYRSTFELAAVGVAHVSQEGRWLRVNRRVCEILGYSEAELMDLTFQEITCPEDLPADLELTKKVISGELPMFTMEKRYIRKNKSVVWVNLSVSAARDAAGRMKHFISVIEDITGRREADELRARLAAIVQSSDDAIVSKDLNGIITSWNPAATEMFGYTEQEAVGQSITIIIPPELREEEASIIDRLRCGERIEHFETVRVKKSGGRINVSLTISPVRDSRGLIIGASKVARDVTDRNHDEEAKARLAAIVATSDDAIVSKDLNGIIKTWNAAAARIFGHSAEEAVGKSIMLIIPPELQEEEAGILGRLRRGERIEHFETVRVNKKGERIDVSLTISPLRDSSGRIIGASKIARDITHRKQVEAALRDSQFQLALALESSKTAMFDWDVVEQRGSWNPQLAALYGFSPAETYIRADEWNSLFHPEDSRRIAEETARALKEQDHFQFEYRTARRDGQVRWILAHGRVFRDKLGTAIRMIGTHTDITDRKQLEEAEKTRELTGKLLHAQDVERRRIARELHDSAGQLIAALQMNLIPMESNAAKVNIELARGIKQSLDLLQQLSSELRTVSYLLHPPLLDEAGLRSALRWYVEGFSERSKISVKLDLSPNLGRLSPDMEMTIFRVVQECLTNIHRHSGSTEASIRVVGSPHEICLEVRDNGKGMPLPKNGSREIRYGVGIQGMRERVRQLNGQFDIQSLGTGTIVTARLPLVDEAVSVA